MGCISSCGRIVLIVLNLVILMASLAVIAVGAIMKFFSGTILETVFGTLSKQNFIDIPNLEEIKYFPFLDDLGLALLIFGCVLFFIAFCACCGACGKWRPLLLVFIIAMSILIIGQAVVGGLFLAKDSPLHNKIKNTVGDEVKKNYKIQEKNAIYLAMNILNFQLDCCGIRGKSDFDETLNVPTCCKKEHIKSNDTKCITANLTDDVFNTEGCYDKIQGKVQDKIITAGVILALILLMQFLEVVFASLIVKDVGKVSPI